MRIPFISFTLCAMLLTFCLPAYTQQIPRIGLLQRRLPPSSTNPDPLADAFRQGLRDLGYIDGKNIRIEHRYAHGRSDLLPRLVVEFVQLKVDVIVVASRQAIRAATQATKTIPIVIVTQRDPVTDGLVQSLARSGGNITGLMRLTSELSGKRLELLKEAVPRVSRVGILSGSANLQAGLQDEEPAAHAQQITLRSLEVRETKPDFEATFQSAASAGVNAIITNRDAVTASHLKRIADLAIEHRLPSMNEDSPYVEAGGLMSYSANDAEQFRRAAYYVDKILKGAKPADLPVEQPTKFDFAINLKTTKQIGLTIPPNVLARADRVIR